MKQQKINIKSIFLVVMISMFSIACATSGLHQASSRHLNKPSGEGNGIKYFKTVTPKKETTPDPDLFFKKKNFKITPKFETYENGSIFSESLTQNDLYSDYVPKLIGNYIQVTIVKIQKEQKDDAAKKAEEENPKEISDQEVSQLLNEMPSLKPPEKSAPRIIKRLRMRIIHTYPNGDYLARWNRMSTGTNGVDESTIRARIPRDLVNRNRVITTNHLSEIDISQIKDGLLYERQATDWQDEYTLRVSGFSEAKSQYAAELESKRQQLSNVKKRLSNRVESLGQERRQLTKLRDQLNKKRLEDQKSLDEMNQKLSSKDEVIEEKQQTIQDQQQTIQDLNTAIEETENAESDDADGE